MQGFFPTQVKVHFDYLLDFDVVDSGEHATPLVIEDGEFLSQLLLTGLQHEAGHVACSPLQEPTTASLGGEKS